MQLRDEIGAPLLPVARAEHERVVVAVRAAMADGAFAAARDEGRALSREGAIDAALDACRPCLPGEKA